MYGYSSITTHEVYTVGIRHWHIRAGLYFTSWFIICSQKGATPQDVHGSGDTTRFTPLKYVVIKFTFLLPRPILSTDTIFVKYIQPYTCLTIPDRYPALDTARDDLLGEM